MSERKQIVVVGAGWAGLGATYHLAQQGYDVTLLEAKPYPGGLVAGWKTPGRRSLEGGANLVIRPLAKVVLTPLTPPW